MFTAPNAADELSRHLALDHLALPIFELEASLDFYLNKLGLPLVDASSGDDWGGKPWLMLLLGLGDGRQLVLIALRGAVREESALPRDARHFAFAVEDNGALLAWQERLESFNVSYWAEAHGAQRSIYFEDPNGIVLEITTPPSSPRTTPSAANNPREIVARFMADAAHQVP